MTSDRRSSAIPAVQIWLFAVIAFPLQALYMAIAVYLPQYYAARLGLELSAVGMAFAAVRLIDLPVDPILGVAIDRTKIGRNRYRIWLLAGTPVTMIAVYMLFMAQVGVSIPQIMFWLLVMYLGTSMMNLAHSAWAASVSPNYNERSKIFAAIGVLGVAGMTLLFAMPLISPKADSGDMAIPAMGWFILISTPIAVMVAILWAPSPAPKRVLASRSSWKAYLQLLFHRNMGRVFLAMLLFTTGTAWEGALFLFYFTDGRGFSVAEASTLLIFALGAGLLGAPAAARLSIMLSKHLAVVTIALLYALALSSLVFVPHENKLLSSAPVITTGFLYAGFHVLLRSMTADVADEVRLSEGNDSGALLYALLTLAPKLAAAAAIGMTFSILDIIGYDPSPAHVNSRAAMSGLEAAYLLGPIAFILAGAACVFGYGLGPNQSAAVREALEKIESPPAPLV